jgi:hypothetical protein
MHHPEDQRCQRPLKVELVNHEYLAHIHLLNLSILRFQGIWCQNYDRPLAKLGELKFLIIEVKQGVC